MYYQIIMLDISSSQISPICLSNYSSCPSCPKLTLYSKYINVIAILGYIHLHSCLHFKFEKQVVQLFIWTGTYLLISIINLINSTGTTILHRFLGQMMRLLVLHGRTEYKMYQRCQNVKPQGIIVLRYVPVYYVFVSYTLAPYNILIIKKFYKHFKKLLFQTWSSFFYLFFFLES